MIFRFFIYRSLPLRSCAHKDARLFQPKLQLFFFNHQYGDMIMPRFIIFQRYRII